MPAVRSMAAPVAAAAAPTVDLLAARRPVPAMAATAVAATAVAATTPVDLLAARPAAVALPTAEDAAKAAWLAKQDVPGMGNNAGRGPAAMPMAAAAAPPQRTPAAGRPEGAKYQYKAAWSKYASSSGNGEFAPRRGQ